MAINKRKDSAALFELIDKSTLKVPKQAGSLKIPSWWSSKSNPPVRPRLNGAGIPETLPAKAAPDAKRQPAADTDAEPQAPVPQQRLFDPPDAAVQGPSPSIRPPQPSAEPRNAIPIPIHSGNGNGNGHGNGNGSHGASNGHGQTATLDPAELAAQVALDEVTVVDEPKAHANPSSEGYAGSGNGRRTFAPQTMSQTDTLTSEWAAQRFRLARTPMWVFVVAVSGIILLLVLIVYLLSGIHWRSPKAAVTPGPSQQVGPVSSQPSLLPPPGQRITTPTPPPANNLLVNHPPAPTPTPSAPGQVFGPGAVARNPALYYIVIATTTAEDIARRNADLIAKNGVDVSIETQAGRNNHMLYKLISVKGFATISEAQPLKKQIVDIGHLLPEFAKTHKAWDDATVIRWSALAGMPKG